jgi:hypothetical protein
MANDIRSLQFEIKLPSRGILYEGKIPDGILHLVPMTTKEEKALASVRGSSITPVDTVLRNCIVDCPIPPDELLTSDRFYILVRLRAESYGRNYDFLVKCPDCRTQFRHSIDLVDGLEIKYMDDDVSEPFIIDLPVSGAKLSCRLLRGKDEKAIIRYTEQVMSKSPLEGDPSYTYRLAKHIVAIDDKTVDVTTALSFVESLTAKDSLKIRNTVDEKDSGVITDLTIDCPRCSSLIEMPLPFTAQFFRPRR